MPVPPSPEKPWSAVPASVAIFPSAWITRMRFVAGVRDEKRSILAQREGGWILQRGAGGRPAVAAEAALAVPGDGPDPP